MEKTLENTAPFVRAYPPEVAPSGPALYLPFRGNDVVLEEPKEGGANLSPLQSLAPDAGWDGNGLFLGTLHGVPVFTFSLPDDAVLPSGHRVVGLRAAYGLVEDALYPVLGYAAQILHWSQSHRYCSHCGGPLTLVAEAKGEKSWGKVCLQCNRSSYPPVVPAVLLLIHDGADRTLLVSKPGWGKRYSIVAGFVEPGESLEECCQREALEEVGVHIGEITYVGSQPWPFPHQLMVGFTARYLSGDIQLDTTELSAGAWFHHSEMPELPPPLSLSRQIIDGWLRSRQARGIEIPR